MTFFAKIILAAFGSLQLVSAASADLVAKFDEGAPKDRFTFTNMGQCAITNAVLKLDLSGSNAGLIFDTTGTGLGVEVYQPLEVVSGSASLLKPIAVNDGDNALEIEVSRLGSNESIAFTVDIDDTLGGREITVSDSEIAGSKVELVQGANAYSASFDASTKARLAVPNC